MLVHVFFIPFFLGPLSFLRINFVNLSLIALYNFALPASKPIDRVFIIIFFLL